MWPTREIYNFYIIPTGLFGLMIMMMMMIMMMKKSFLETTLKVLCDQGVHVQMSDSLHRLIIGTLSLSYHFSFGS